MMLVYELKFQISCNLGECIVVITFMAVSIWHQFLNNFFGEFIVEKVDDKYIKYILFN